MQLLHTCTEEKVSYKQKNGNIKDRWSGSSTEDAEEARLGIARDSRHLEVKGVSKPSGGSVTCGDAAGALAGGASDAVSPRELHIGESSNIFLPIPIVQQVLVLLYLLLAVMGVTANGLHRPHCSSRDGRGSWIL